MIWSTSGASCGAWAMANWALAPAATARSRIFMRPPSTDQYASRRCWERMSWGTGQALGRRYHWYTGSSRGIHVEIPFRKVLMLRPTLLILVAAAALTAAPAQDVTFHKDIAPILQAQCQGCHRPGE